MSEEPFYMPGKKPKKGVTKPGFFSVFQREKGSLNQYWYSSNTVKKIVEEVERFATRVACLSTPSVFFSMTNTELQSASMIFDIDRELGRNMESNFNYFYYRKLDTVGPHLHGKVDFVVVDPPSIQREDWQLYAAVTKLLLSPGGRILCTTIHENEQLLEELLHLHANVFLPSIPNLVYQYFIFTNYDSELFSIPNPEIGWVLAKRWTKGWEYFDT